MSSISFCFVESSWNLMAHGDAGGEVKGKLANGVGSQYPSHYLRTWCIQHYYCRCAHLGCQQSTELTPTSRFKWTRPFHRRNLVFCACAITFQLTCNIVRTCINACTCPLFLSDFNQNWSLLINFNMNHHFQILWKFVYWFLCGCMWGDVVKWTGIYFWHSQGNAS